jgi:hypothetical protein
MSDDETTQVKNPSCPQCGSDDTAPIHHEPMWVTSDQSDPSRKEDPWYRCLTCRHKWKEGEGL